MNSVQRFYRDFDLERHAKRARLSLPLLLKLLNGRRKVLDLACGYGRIAIPLAKKGFEVYGVDISKNLLEKAKRKARASNVKVDFRCGSFLKIPFGDGYFEGMIVIWSSFCHLLNRKDQVKALKEIRRVLEKDGIAIIDLPYYRRITGITVFEGQGKEIELYCFNKKLLKSLSKSAGFRDIRILTETRKGRKRNYLILKR